MVAKRSHILKQTCSEKDRETQRDREKDTDRDGVFNKKYTLFVKACDNIFINYISTIKYCYSYQIYK